jgi:hypothetical protein
MITQSQAVNLVQSMYPDFNNPSVSLYTFTIPFVKKDYKKTITGLCCPKFWQ